MSRPAHRVAAVDIGSNAMRAVIATIGSREVTFFKNYRWPLRLGADVFHSGRISPKRFKMTEDAFGELFWKLAKHQVDTVYAVATSAMRDSLNGAQLVEAINKQTGIQVEVIGGDKEARLIKKAVGSVVDLSAKTALMIDVGGGSAEITLTKNGHTIVSESFDFGTVRMLESARGDTFEKDVEAFASQVRNLVQSHTKKVDLFIGTGGNLRRMGKLRKMALRRPSNKIAIHELQSLYMELSELSIKKRMECFKMRRDRADVIVFAMAMIEQIMVDLDIKEILLPRVGLKEGVILQHLPAGPKKIHLQVKYQ